ncbi:UNVERIFIED_CONTAM: hypothetical protein Sradi_4124400 [Sesamum radiatum]|uniref:Uncharacterized protein n=1 Tax=Sesamum radiatum TaxID=300843 RepID=A0AAW2P3Q4_SESRA
MIMETNKFNDMDYNDWRRNLRIVLDFENQRLDSVPSIMLRMKEVYAAPDRHTRYAATKAFLGTKTAEGSFVHSHGIKMLSLVEKLEDLKAGLNNDTYIDNHAVTSFVLRPIYY